MTTKLIVLSCVCGVWIIVRFIKDFLDDIFDWGDYEVIGNWPDWLFYPLVIIFHFFRKAILPAICFGIMYFIWG